MKKILLCIASCLLLSINTNAQKALCGFDAIMKEQRSNLETKNQLIQAEKKIQDFLKSPVTMGTVINGTDTVYEIPVVVHIIHTGGAIGSIYNPSDATITGMIDYLNQTYAATWPSYPDVNNGGVNIPIRFKLAQRTPECTATSGIVRFDNSANSNYVSSGVNRSNSSGITDTDLKSLSNWNHKNYYNIWIVNKIDGSDGTSGSFIAGYAYFPGASAAVDGTVMLATQAVAGQSTLPHEIGHAMGLYHTFEGESNNSCPPAESPSNCSSIGDKVCDTEPHTSMLGTCPSASANNPCTNNPFGTLPNNIMNYSQCPTLFTQGQANRAKASLLTLRSQLITSQGLTAPPPTTVASTCTPAAPTDSSNNFNVGISKVRLNEIGSLSNGFSIDGRIPVIDNTCNQSATINTTQSNSITVAAASNPTRVKVWIDLNNDGTLDNTSELIYQNSSLSNFDSVTVALDSALIATAVLNTPLRMRVGGDFAGAADFTPCSQLQYGQFEDYTVQALNTVLPLRLTGFKAAYSIPKKAVQLNWTVEDAFEALQYTIEKSRDGSIFTPIATIQQHQTQNQYTYNDQSTHQGLSYYRLKIEDKLGHIFYSKIERIVVANSDNIAFNIFPNPATTKITLNANQNTKVDYEIYNIIGLTLRSEQGIALKKNSGINIDISKLPKGLYFIKVLNENGAQKLKFVKK